MFRTKETYNISNPASEMRPVRFQEAWVACLERMKPEKNIILTFFLVPFLLLIIATYSMTLLPLKIYPFICKYCKTQCFIDSSFCRFNFLLKFWL